MILSTHKFELNSTDGLASGYQRTNVTTAGARTVLETGGQFLVNVIELPVVELLLPDETGQEKPEEKPRGPIFMDVERQKLELDITQEFEFADGEATLLIDEKK